YQAWVWTKVRFLTPGMEIAVLGSDSLKFEKITSIEKVGREEVFDIEIEGTHNFVGNGIVAHNTALDKTPRRWRRQRADRRNASRTVYAYRYSE
ncbi:hypothetical protein HY339_02710, partial [Candidatus Gottesmanbacteria bacterium]|nr:hypothetical protein [Candidatus Gottesmanbacteria bacterium]